MRVLKITVETIKFAESRNEYPNVVVFWMQDGTPRLAQDSNSGFSTPLQLIDDVDGNAFGIMERPFNSDEKLESSKGEAL